MSTVTAAQIEYPGGWSPARLTTRDAAKES